MVKKKEEIVDIISSKTVEVGDFISQGIKKVTLQTESGICLCFDTVFPNDFDCGDEIKIKIEKVR